MTQIIFNETLLKRVTEFPYANAQEYVTIQSCKAACQGLQMKMDVLQYGLLLIIALLIFYIAYDKIIKNIKPNKPL